MNMVGTPLNAVDLLLRDGSAATRFALKSGMGHMVAPWVMDDVMRPAVMPKQWKHGHVQIMTAVRGGEAHAVADAASRR